MKKKQLNDAPIGYTYQYTRENPRSGEYKTYQKSKYAFDKQTIREALRNENSYSDIYEDTYTTLTDQLKLLELDIDSDLERHKIMDYQSMYKDTTLQSIYNEYVKVYNLILSSKKWNFSRAKTVKQKLNKLKENWGLKNTKSIKDEESNNKLYVFKGVSYVDPNDPNDYYICDEEFNVIAESKDQAVMKLLNKLGNHKNRSLSIDFTIRYDSSDIYKKFDIIV